MPFWLAVAEIPERGVAVRPVALMVPVMPTSPVVPERLYEVVDAGALKFFVPNEDADGVGKVRPGMTTEAEKE